MDRVVYKNYNFEITVREVIASIAIFFICMTAGLYFDSKIQDNFANERARTAVALQIDNNSEMFNQAIDTQVGDLLAYGTLVAIDPVSLPGEIEEQYLYIYKVEEHYVKKYRTVTYSCGKDNKETCTKIEEYWEWDRKNSWSYNATQINYLNRTFPYTQFSGFVDSHLVTIKTSSHVRFKYSIVPTSLNGTIKARASNEGLIGWNGRKINFNTNRSIDQVISSEKSWQTFSITLYWLFWLGITIVGIYVFYVAENKYLYSKN